MAYIDEYDVMNKLQYLTLTGSSKPSLTDVTEIITRVEAEIDARFRAVGITAPIIDSTLVNIPESIALNGVAAEILRAIQQESDDADRYQRLYDEAMSRIESKPSILETATSGTDYIAPSGYTSSETRPFRRGENDW